MVDVQWEPRLTADLHHQVLSIALQDSPLAALSWNSRAAGPSHRQSEDTSIGIGISCSVDFIEHDGQNGGYNDRAPGSLNQEPIA